MTEQRLQVLDVQSDDYPVYDGTADNINNSRTVKSSVEDDYSLAGGAQIAYGRYYKLDKDGNPIEDPRRKIIYRFNRNFGKRRDEALAL